MCRLNRFRQICAAEESDPDFHFFNFIPQWRYYSSTFLFSEKTKNELSSLSTGLFPARKISGIVQFTTKGLKVKK